MVARNSSESRSQNKAWAPSGRSSARFLGCGHSPITWRRNCARIGGNFNNMEPIDSLVTHSSCDTAQLDRELLKFLRQESEANRKALRDDAGANRKALLGTLKIVSYPLAVVLAVAAFLGWRSFENVKTSIHAEAEQETKTEITRMQDEIRKKLSDQFETPQLQKVVKQAAADQTQGVLRPLIQHEVASDVAKSVKAEDPTIRASVVSETRRAVGALEPKVSQIVSDRVNATVDASVDAKITSQVKPILTSLQNDQQVSSLVLRVYAGSGSAFDALVQLAQNRMTDPGVAQTASQVIKNVILQHSAGSYTGRHFLLPETLEEMVQMLENGDPGNRQAALDQLSDNEIRHHLNQVVRIMTSDSDLNVREAGFRRFLRLKTGEDRPETHIEILDNAAALTARG